MAADKDAAALSEPSLTEFLATANGACADDLYVRACRVELAILAKPRALSTACFYASVDMRVLFVEDDSGVRRSVSRLLRDMPGVEVDEAGTLDAALDALARVPPEMMLVDVCLTTTADDRGGLSAISHARAIGCHAHIVVLTGMSESDIAIDAMRAGANDFIQKGSLTPESLKEAVSLARTKSRGTPATAEAELDRAAKIVGALPGSLSTRLAKIELNVIEAMLADCERNMSEAARRLGVDRKVLERRLATARERRRRPVS